MCILSNNNMRGIPMIFTHNKLIANSRELSWYWSSHQKDFIVFPDTDVNGGRLDFSHPLDYFDIDSDSAERLRKIGEPYDIFNNTLRIAKPELELLIFKGLNDNDGIGSLLWQFTNSDRERQIYGIYASLFYIGNSIYCALTICYVDKDFGCEQPTAILEISQDEGPFISPILINKEASDLFSFDDMQMVGEYIANVWFGIQYELINCPEEIRFIEQRGPVEPSYDYQEGHGIVYVKKIIPLDENGNLIKYKTKNSGRIYKKPAWNVRGHLRTLKDGREVPVRPYPKGPERDNSNAINPKQYVFDDSKINEDAK